MSDPIPRPRNPKGMRPRNGLVIAFRRIGGLDVKRVTVLTQGDDAGA
jgi:hypothetical protein